VMAVGVDTLALIINAERNGAGAPIAERHKKVKFWRRSRMPKLSGHGSSGRRPPSVAGAVTRAVKRTRRMSGRPGRAGRGSFMGDVLTRKCRHGVLIIDASLGSLSVTLSVSPLSVVRRRIIPPGVLGGTDEPGGQEASARCP
jgi:hypothetical protein